MIESVLFWIYMANAIVLLNHEIDSAYWQEWKLINPKDDLGINGFLWIHFPILFIVLYGLVLVEKGHIVGYIVSLFLGATGIFAFFFHFYHIRKGRPEFNTRMSKSILVLALVLSVLQILFTIGAICRIKPILKYL